jgi:hypothetical protein
MSATFSAARDALSKKERDMDSEIHDIEEVTHTA